MVQSLRAVVAGLFLFVFICYPLGAQNQKIVTLRMMDSRTGKLIPTSDFLVQINHQQTVHADWVQLNEDGSGKLTLPSDATLILIHGKYDNSMSLYVNCDVEKKGKIPTLDTMGDDRWYNVSDIVGTGVIGHNGCGKGKDSASLTPKPGEFTFFVRKLNWHEENDMK